MDCPVKYEVEGVSIVLLGSFNPVIFQPAWFVLNKILPKYDVLEPKINIIHNQITQFRLDWLKVEVTQDRFSASTSETANYTTLRDFVVSTFAILEHTPITRLGVNKDIHYRAENEETWNKIGDTLAPKDIWQETLREPGLTSLKIQTPRDDDLPGRINVQLAPSAQVTPHGVFMGVNHHIELDALAKDDDQTSEQLATILENNWDALLQSADKIIETTITKAI